MKTTLVLGLLASAALLAPAASAHIITYINNDCANPITVSGGPNSPPHGWVGVTNCPYNHDGAAPGAAVFLP